MERDFTLNIYTRLVHAIGYAGYKMMSYEEYVTGGNISAKAYVLRHDVDAKPFNSVQTATIESRAGAKGTYYFRIIPGSNVPAVIEKIATMGHEIGYHYEDLAMCKGNYERAYENFLKNLEYFRTYYPVKTICMHGSPLSKWDNRKLWEKYDYKKSGILAEPYFDTDFSRMLYITDTSRRWNGGNYSVRDKVSGLEENITSTAHLISKLNEGSLPSHIMQNIHPQRWSDNYAEWVWELVFQNAKNVVKGILVRKSV